MKLFRVSILKKSETLAIPDEAYVGADTAQAALSVVFAALPANVRPKVLSWNIDLVGTTLLIDPSAV